MAETQIFDVELIEQQLIDVSLTSVDLIPRISHITEAGDTTITNPQNGDILIYEDDYWINKSLEELESEIPNFIFNEVPTKINSKRFQLANTFRTGTLRVFLNGIKEKQIVIINSTTFEFKIDTVTEDDIEVSYIKQ